MFSNKRLSSGTLLIAGLLSVLVSLGTFSPASASGLAHTGASPVMSATQGKATIIVLDGTSMVPKPLIGATVAFWDTKGALVAKGLTDQTGQFSNLMTVGTYKVRVTVNGFKPGTNVVVVKSGERVTLLMSLFK